MKSYTLCVHILPFSPLVTLVSNFYSLVTCLYIPPIHSVVFFFVFSVNKIQSQGIHRQVLEVLEVLLHHQS